MKLDCAMLCGRTLCDIQFWWSSTVGGACIYVCQGAARHHGGCRRYVARCSLAKHWVQMVYGKTPFADVGLGHNMLAKVAAICDPRHTIRFPPCGNPLAVDTMARCLERDKLKRPTIPVRKDHWTGASEAMLTGPGGRAGDFSCC